MDSDPQTEISGAPARPRSKWLPSFRRAEIWSYFGPAFVASIAYIDPGNFATNIHGEMVLADLARFCRANEPCFMKDDRYHALLEGRREVWLRIQNELKLPIE